jgi:methylated-DNA-[protein]-cysteine S-methyltransferase
MENIFFYETIIGLLGIKENGTNITEIYFGKDEIPINIELKETSLIKKTIDQLEEYFEGKRKSFDLPFEPKGTEFQKSVWNELLKIPYGETCSYGEIAKRIGNPKASRAIGMANNRNPISIIIPCHRVIGASGKLVGYGGGIDIKEKLLNLEKENL